VVITSGGKDWSGKGNVLQPTYSLRELMVSRIRLLQALVSSIGIASVEYCLSDNVVQSLGIISTGN